MQKTQTARNAIVAAARTQLGVPYLKDAEVANVAMHCTGLLSYAFQVGVGLTLVRDVKQGACAGFRDDRILDFLSQAGCSMSTLETCRPGDIIVWTYAGTPHHTGIITETYPELAVIHSSAFFGKVAEHPLTRGQWKRRFHSVWSVERPLLDFLEGQFV